MYRNLLLLTLLLTAVLPLHAVNPTVLERAVANAARQQTTWAQRLHKMEHSYRLARASYPPDSLPVCRQDTLGPAEEHRYLQRLSTLLLSVSKHPDLTPYQFVAPIPRDLANLSPEKWLTLQQFLMAKQATPTVLRNVQYPRPFTLALQLGRGADALEIWIDVPTHKIYLMTDNFYTTAAGKYGLHLF